ncbi:MAG: hypothetical protein GY915_09250 [bacterium]|nr:hypothetical protein [bacterium]
MAKRLRYGKGKASIEIDGTLKEMLEKALRESKKLAMAQTEVRVRNQTMGCVFPMVVFISLLN